MTHAEVYATVSEIVPCRHMDWGDEKAPKLPWALYTCEETPLAMDDSEEIVRHDWTVELYQERRNKTLENKLGKAIRTKFGPYTKRESWVKSEGMLMVTYDFHQIEGVE